MPKILDLKDKKLGRLLVLERVRVPKSHNVMWRCICDCGNETIAAAANIGKTTFSCGCLAKETAAELLRGNRTNRTHNMSHTPEHNTWLAIKQRCYNSKCPRYPDYGGRGIVVCKRWLASFASFYLDMGSRPSSGHSIERTDVNGNYDPDNCKWANKFEQARNKRNISLIEIDGVSKCISGWCDYLGIKRWKVYEPTRYTNQTAEDVIRNLVFLSKSSEDC